MHKYDIDAVNYKFKDILRMFRVPVKPVLMSSPPERSSLQLGNFASNDLFFSEHGHVDSFENHFQR